ncbi:MAG: hypothetical protein ACQEQJ_03250 [Halobacteriota archaeon]
MQRRSFIATLGAGAIASLAGCQTAVGSVALPSVPDDALDSGGWEQLDQTKDETVIEETYGPVTVEAVASSVTYTDAALREQVRADTLSTVETDLALFSATRIDMAPSVDELGPVRSEVKKQIRTAAIEELRAQMDAAGITNVEETGTGTIEVASGTTAEMTELTGSYPVEDMKFPVSEDTAITIEGGELPVDAVLAVWSANGNYLVAGGAYPAENFTRETDTALTDAISVSVDIDLGLTPDAYREELLDLIAGVS